MKKLAVFLAFSLAGCSNMQNDRVDYVARGTSNEIRCPTPPADIVETFKKGDVDFSLKLNEIQKIALNSNIGIERKYEKIRDIDPQLQTIETVHYRLCVEYTNGTFTKDEYKEIIRGLPLYNHDSKSQPASSSALPNIELPKRSPIAPAGTWVEESLGLAVKVGGIGGACLSPCKPIIKANMEIKTSSYIMPNYEAIEGAAIAFTHNNKTYKLTIEEIKTKPAYIVVSVDEIKT
ncbi:hypothetical protein [Pseudomonas sp. Q1-7]|uniref:hypothetical protein n=1 Tax=Pseudomonas sp. Q1-7 TaxID=3020843 RepID=UPI002301DC8C|nr:hypothetical protein [Pseudomonas sp. Q1-7]